MPTPLHMDDKPEFSKKPMVEWYSIPQLINTAFKTILSSIFGSYADKREIQAAMNPGFDIYDYSKHKEMWVDYVADLGDGFDSTYTIARLLAEEQLKVNGQTLHRGDVLIMGGDEVYPTPTREEYKNRMKIPYELALPQEKGREAHLYAIPGNHDWYDGLTNFLKIFCQKRGIGGWKTRQAKSYFALKLPYNCWIWGIDIQLEADIDKPQLDYFEDVARQMQPGDKVILCSAIPAWVFTALKYDNTYRNLRFFEKKFIEDNQFQLVLSLAGDLHHYNRYAHAEGKEMHKITSGGGGAFLHPTHNLPPELDELREGTFTLKKAFPSKLISRGLLFGNFAFPWFNKQFTLFMGIFFLFMTWMLQSITWEEDDSLLDSFSTLSLSISHLKDFVAEAIGTLIYGPLIFFMFALLILGLYHFADKNSIKHRWLGILGIFHGVVQIGAWFILIWIFARWNIHLLDLPINGWLQVLLFTVEMVLLGGTVSSLIMGLYLLLSNLLLGIHNTESFSGLKLMHFKNFLRIHITSNSLVIYPIGINKITIWKKNKKGKAISFEGKLPEITLIENPISIGLGPK